MNNKYWKINYFIYVDRKLKSIPNSVSSFDQQKLSDSFNFQTDNELWTNLQCTLPVKFKKHETYWIIVVFLNF